MQGFLDFASSIFLFGAVLSVLIVVHEWGHYFAAVRMGIRVDRFSIGFGRILMRRIWRDTEFCLSAVPLGGYVSLAGENAGKAVGKPWEYHSRPAWQRAFVILAGPAMNAVLAFVIFSIVFMIGFPSTTAKVGEVIEGYPAQNAGLKKGDIITKVDQEPIEFWQDLLVAIQKNEGSFLTVEYERDGRLKEARLAPRVDIEETGDGPPRRVGRIGVKPSEEFIVVRYSFFKAIGKGLQKVFVLTGLILWSLWMMITGSIPFQESFTGPIGIFVLTKQMADVGMIYLLNFTALLSVSLFVINLFPMPALDGGHLLFIGIESVMRRPLSEKTKERCTQVGFYLLLLLIVYVIYIDVDRFDVFEKLASFLSFGSR